MPGLHKDGKFFIIISPYFQFRLQDFHAQTSNFTIPKTKKQTRNGKSSKESPQGERLQSNGHRKVPTQLQLMPDAQGRATKRTNASEGKTPKKLRRSWEHTSTPRRSDDDVSPQQNDGCNCSPQKVSPSGMGMYISHDFMIILRTKNPILRA
jgi:hypothetical protein